MKKSSWIIILKNVTWLPKKSRIQWIKNNPILWFDAIAVRKELGNLEFISVGGYETRNEATIRQIQSADLKYNFFDFPCTIINTDDVDYIKEFHNTRVLSYSTSKGRSTYKFVSPDFVFDHWREVNIDDYDKVCNEISKIGRHKPETDLLGWRGVITHGNRYVLVKKHDNKNIDAAFITWNKRNRSGENSNNYVSIPDHVKKWRYLIDIEGRGWSARTKFFFFSRRVLFLQERPFNEYYYPKLIPWVHYVPVKRDLSDLMENLNKIKNDLDLEKFICEESYKFAAENLTRDNCLYRWKNLLNTKFFA